MSHEHYAVDGAVLPHRTETCRDGVSATATGTTDYRWAAAALDQKIEVEITLTSPTTRRTVLHSAREAEVGQL